MLVTGGPPTFGGGGMPPAHHGQFAIGAGIADDGRGIVGKDTRYWGQIPDVAVDHAKEGSDGWW